MLIVIALIGAVLLTAGITVYVKHHKGIDYDYLYCTLNIIGGILFGAAVVAIVACGARYSMVIPIDEKIAIYEDENAAIEAQIAAVVENYKGYEMNALTALKPSESPAIVLSMYPELKADALVSKQIDVYVENNAVIKQLKAEKASYKVYAWWLYFGGVK